MRRAVLLALLVSLAAPAGAAAREGRCPDRPGYRVVERSGDAVLLARDRTAGFERTTTYRACLRSVGRDPLVETTYLTDYGEGSAGVRTLFNGRFLAMFTEAGNKYHDVQRFVSLVDLASGRRLAATVPTTDSVATAPWELFEAVLGPHGHVAWTEGHPGRPQMRALVDGAVLELLPPAPVEPPVAVDGLRMEGDVLHWNLAGRPRAHRLRGVDAAAPSRPLRCRRPRGYELHRAGARALVFVRGYVAGDRGPYPWHACLRSSPRRPVTLAARADRVLLHGERAAVVAREGAGRWRVWTFDVRARRRVGRAVRFAASGPIADAARAGDRLALSIGARLVLVEPGGVRTVATGSGPMTAIRLDPAAVAWVENGEPRAAPLR